MTHYIIEFRLQGTARNYAKELIYDVARKFRVKGITRKKVVPHITLYGPFTTKNQKKMVSEVYNLCRKYDRIYFSLVGFNYFNNPSNKVIYLDIQPSEDLKRLRYELSSVLKPITFTNSKEDRKGKEDFVFHSTLAYKDIDKKFNKIWNYISKRKKMEIKQTLLRITILKNSRILYEYDFSQKRLLNRREALNRNIFRRTIELLKKPYIKNQIIPVKVETKKESFWDKIKKFFIGS